MVPLCAPLVPGSTLTLVFDASRGCLEVLVNGLSMGLALGPPGTFAAIQTPLPSLLRQDPTQPFSVRPCVLVGPGPAPVVVRSFVPRAVLAVHGHTSCGCLLLDPVGPCGVAPGLPLAFPPLLERSLGCFVGFLVASVAAGVAESEEEQAAAPFLALPVFTAAGRDPAYVRGV